MDLPIYFLYILVYTYVEGPRRLLRKEFRVYILITFTRPHLMDKS